jgi:hypothetical protein
VFAKGTSRVFPYFSSNPFFNTFTMEFMLAIIDFSESLTMLILFKAYATCIFTFRKLSA